MRFEDLAGRWQARELANTARDPGREVAAIRERAVQLDRAVQLRDMIESAVALLMLPIFVWLAFRVPGPVSKAGATLVAIGCAIIPIRLRLARGWGADPTLPVLASLEVERAHLQAQVRLLRTVLWWYLGPLLLGVLLFLIGSLIGPRANPPSAIIGIVIGCAVTIALGVVLYRANLATAERELEPVVARLDEAIRDLTAASPGDTDAR